MFNPTIFREYDIRGIADIDFDELFAHQLGCAFGTLLKRKNKTSVAVGRDLRLSSEKYTSAVINGLLQSGLNVYHIGFCPTPVLYFSLFNYPVDGGIMITASHNPPEYNGFKICDGKNSLYGQDLLVLKKMIDEKTFCDGEKKGALFEINANNDYFIDIKNRISFKRPLKLVLDAGNACASILAPKLFTSLGCQVTSLFCEPDGTFPNHHPDPTVPENLISLISEVKRTGADFGVSYDGDADRLGVVDELGNILWGDMLMVLFSREILKKHPGAIIMSEVKSSQKLYDDIKKNGGKPLMWKTGHSLIKAKMKETKALLAGEMSGHMFFADEYYGFDDAIYASLRLARLLSQTDKKLSELTRDLPKSFTTAELRVDCPDEKKFVVVEKVREHFRSLYKITDIDGVRIQFDTGWGLVRASNTQPVLVLRFEAPNREECEKYKRIVETALQPFL